MPADYVQIHHADYLDDIPFWLSLTERLDPVFEIGCGHGRVTIPLLQAGRKVIGIDSDKQSMDYLNRVLREQFPRYQESFDPILADVLEYDVLQPVSSVIIPCNTYSTFPAIDRFELVKKLQSWINPGGVFAASLPNPVILDLLREQLREADESAPEYESSLVHPETGNPVQVSSRFRIFEDRLGWDWIYDHLLPDGNVERVVRSADHDLATPDGYREELLGAGFNAIEFLGDFDRSDYRPDSPYLILVCSV